MIDNYDSFTYNIVQYLAELKADVKVVRNDEISIADMDYNSLLHSICYLLVISTILYSL